MKKLLYLFLTATALSCSSDDSSSNNNTENFLGKWAYQSIVTGNNTNVPLDPCDTGVSKEFKSNNTVVDTYVCSGATQTDTYRFSVSGTVLTYTVENEIGPGSDYIVKYNILELTSSQLIIKEFNNNVEGNVNGNKITFSKIQ